MEISASQTTSMIPVPASPPVRSEPYTPVASTPPAPEKPAAEGFALQFKQESKETTPPASVEELAIRAAFQAQLTTGELLSVVRDPADLVLPDAPKALTA